MSSAAPFIDPVFEHAEGPVWFDDLQALRWVDMLAGDVVGLAPDGAVSRRRVGTVAAAVRPRRGGGAAIMLERGLITVPRDPLATSTVESEVPLVHQPGVRLNEGGCDPQGRFLCGSMGWDAEPGAGSLVRVTAGAEPAVELVRSAVTISNGIGFDAEGATCYYIDSTTHQIEVIEYGDEGRTFEPVRTIDLTAYTGLPDGLAVDADGRIWVAMYGGGCVLAFSPHGELVDRIDLPTTRVTACAFGDEDLGTLYITTSALGLDRSAEPLAGAVFAVRPGARGQLPLAYAG